MGPRPPIAVAPLFWREEGLKHWEVNWLPRWDKVWRLLWFFCLSLWPVPHSHESHLPRFSQTRSEQLYLGCSAPKASQAQKFEKQSQQPFDRCWCAATRVSVTNLTTTKDFDILLNKVALTVMHQNVCWTVKANLVFFIVSMISPWGLEVCVHVVTLKLPESFSWSKTGYPSIQSMSSVPHLHVVLVIQISLRGIFCPS